MKWFNLINQEIKYERETDSRKETKSIIDNRYNNMKVNYRKNKKGNTNEI